MMRVAVTADEVKVRTLPTQVAAVLVRAIAGGDLVGGQGPSELEIIRQFGVSRSVAREALKILASLDMVEIAQGRRITVRPAAEWDYLSPLLIEWLPAEQVDGLLGDLHRMRLVLEPELAAAAAAAMDSETLRRMGLMLDRMRAVEDQPDRYLEEDLEFHMEICKAARNRLLDRIMYSSRWLLTASRRVTNLMHSRLDAVTEAHRAIYVALEQGDPEAARHAMRTHLQRGSAALLLGHGSAAGATLERPLGRE